jgi:hypothetical protein
LKTSINTTSNKLYNKRKWNIFTYFLNGKKNNKCYLCNEEEKYHINYTPLKSEEINIKEEKEDLNKIYLSFQFEKSKFRKKNV